MTVTRIVPITHGPVDEDEALMRAEFIAKARKIRESIKELLDEEYLYSPNLSLDDTKRVGEHLRDSQTSLETAICYVRPAHPKWEEVERQDNR